MLFKCDKCDYTFNVDEQVDWFDDIDPGTYRYFMGEYRSICPKCKKQVSKAVTVSMNDEDIADWIDFKTKNLSFHFDF